MDGISAACPTWCEVLGPCAVDGFETVRSGYAPHGVVTVYGVDKFQRMVDTAGRSSVAADAEGAGSARRPSLPDTT